MDLVRLGDRIDWKSRRDAEREPVEAADYIAQDVFNPDSDQSEVNSWYVQSQPAAKTRAYAKLLPEGTPQLGCFEAKLIHKVLKPRRPVLCIKGPIGCGKTTAKNYVLLGLVARRGHVCHNCGAQHRRLIAEIDFNAHRDLNDWHPDDLTQAMSKLLCEELRGRLVSADILNGDEEFMGFWAHEVQQYRTNVDPSKAFRVIIAQTGSVKPLESESPTPEEVAVRKRALEHVESDGELYLDYLVRLWRFLIRGHYNGNRGCAFVLLDNVDRVAPAVQRSLLELVLAHAKQKGPTFVLLMRPETVARAGLGVTIVDTVLHEGPTPIEVVLDRWRRFSKSPDAHFDSDADLDEDTFSAIKSHLGRLLTHVSGDSRLTFQSYIENACGKSIRIALLTAQSLFRLSSSLLGSRDVSINAVIRTCIRGGKAQFNSSNRHVTEHLFKVSGEEEDDLLVKSRILRYLGRHPRSPKRLNEIYNLLIGFGYAPRMIQRAVNDLMQFNHQLIRSDGFDFFYEDDALEDFGGYAVALTAIGQGYARDLIRNADYVQEVMLDTMVDGDRFQQGLRFGYLREKFALLLAFLDELRLLDLTETRGFVDAFTVKAYSDAFGRHLVSLDVIHGVYPSVVRILAAAEGNAPAGATSYAPLVSEFRSLVLTAENDNHDVLGVWAKSPVEEESAAG